MQYQIVNTITKKLDSDFSAAEAHGMAAGMISVNHSLSPGFWLGEILQRSDDIGFDDQAILEELFTGVYGLLVNEDFEFTLLLPGDDAPLFLRLEALRQWCQGYLFGMSYGTAAANWPEEILEVIRDMTEFTKLDSAAEGEEAENDFMELTEYVKTGVIFINAELNPVRNSTVH